MSVSIFERFLSTGDIAEAFSDTAMVQAMLRFEAALARAQSQEGIFSPAVAQSITGVCRAELYDVPAIVAQSGRAGSLAIPVVKQLTETVALFDAEAAKFVHWGSTSQDVIDTGMVLLTRRALELIGGDLDRLISALRGLAEEHLETPVLGRTLMQPAQVVTFGFKVAGWTASLARCRARLEISAERALSLQLGGAVGTLAVMGDKAPAVARRMADDLGVRLPVANWHTNRDEWIALGAEVGILCGVLGKIARDFSLMMQGEIAEISEPSAKGRGGSSAMPHKRNPISTMIALAAAYRAPHRVAALLSAMGQEHERGLGNWHAELAEWSGLFVSAHGAVHALAEAASGLQVDAARMLQNIDALQGLVFAEAVSIALAKAIGRTESHALMEDLTHAAVAERRHLLDVVLDRLRTDSALGAKLEGKVTETDLRALFDPVAAGQPAKNIGRALLDGLEKPASR